MKGLILKDLYSIKNYAKSYLFMLLFFMVFAVAMKSPQYMVVMGMVIGVSTLFVVLSIDESSGYAFSMTLPVTRKQIVQEKYLFFGGALCCIGGATMILSLVINLFVGENVAECAASALVCAAFYLLIMALVLPTALKWNVQKARYVLLAAVAVPCVLVVFLVQRAGRTLSVLENVFDTHVAVILTGICVAAIVIYIVSYIISVKIFEKKEF